MKRVKKIPLSLGCLFLIASIIIIFNLMAVPQNAIGPEGPPESGLAQLSPQEALWQLSPLITSRSVEKIAESMRDLPIDKAQAIALTIINDTKLPLIRNDKIELLAALALQYPNDGEKQAMFFKLLVEHKQFQEGEPLLFVIAAGDYQRVIPAFLEWLATYNQNVLKLVTRDAVEYVIEKNRFTEFKRLLNYGIFISPNMATLLLWDAVDKNNDIHFIRLLIDAGADVNMVYNNKYTPLIRAVEHNNYKAVQELLKAGGKVNLIPDPTIGSALQIAVRKRFGKIDLLLREHGARE